MSARNKHTRLYTTKKRAARISRSGQHPDLQVVHRAFVARRRNRPPSDRWRVAFGPDSKVASAVAGKRWRVAVGRVAEDFAVAAMDLRNVRSEASWMVASTADHRCRFGKECREKVRGCRMGDRFASCATLTPKRQDHLTVRRAAALAALSSWALVRTTPT